MKIALYILGFLCICISCAQQPDYPDEPVIAFERMNINQLVQGDGSQTLTVTLSFTDGDGDLGDFNNEQNIQVMDTRDSFFLAGFSVPDIPIAGGNNGVTGEIDIKFNGSSLCCIDPDENFTPCLDTFTTYPRDTLFYEIQLIDRAGNRSNIVRTDPIFLNCDFR